MATEWIDPLEQYGGITNRMLDGVWAELNGVTLSTVNPRTGTYHLRINAGSNNSGARRVLSGETQTCGLGFAFNISRLPGNERSLALGQLLNKFNAPTITVMVLPTGAVVVKEGGRTGTIIAESGPEVVMPESYQHFECALNAGNFEVRIDSTTVCNVAGLTLDDCAQFMVGGCYGYPKSGAVLLDIDVDDIFAWNGTGPTVNTWVGDKRAWLRVPVSDGTAADWMPNTGTTMYAILDNVPPNDAQYVLAEDAGAKASVGIEALPSGVVSITAAYAMARLWKTDAGVARVAINIGSGGDDSGLDPVSISNRPRWYGAPVDVDPATGMPFTVPGFNGINLLLDRTE